MTPNNANNNVNDNNDLDKIQVVLTELARIAVNQTNENSVIRANLKAITETQQKTTEILTKIQKRKRKNDDSSSDEEGDTEGEYRFSDVEVYVNKKVAHKLLNQKSPVPLTALIQNKLADDSQVTKVGNFRISNAPTKTIKNNAMLHECITAFKAVFTNIVPKEIQLNKGVAQIALYIDRLANTNKEDGVKRACYAWRVIMQELCSTVFGEKTPTGFAGGVPNDIKMRLEADFLQNAHAAVNRPEKPDQGGKDKRNPGNGKKAQVCFNFNKNAGCTREECNRSHACIKCNKTAHGIQGCTVATQDEKDKVEHFKRKN